MNPTTMKVSKKDKDMKRYFAFILLAIAMVFLISCTQESSMPYGMLDVEIRLGITKDLQATSMETASFNIAVKNSYGVTILNYYNTTRTSYLISAPAGYYTAEVEALNIDGIVIGSGTASGEVRSGQTNTLNVIVQELQGMGFLSIVIPGNSEDVLSYSITHSATEEVTSGSLFYSSGVFSASVNLQNGTYTLRIMRNGETIAVEVVRIIAGLAVLFNAEMSEEEGLVVIDNRIVKTPQITVSLNKSEFGRNEQLMASASVEGIEGTAYCWIVDGNDLEITDDYSDLVFPLEGLKPGIHKVALFVADGYAIWSGCLSFSVSEEESGSIPNVPLFNEAEAIEVKRYETLFGKYYEARMRITSDNPVMSFTWTDPDTTQDYRIEITSDAPSSVQIDSALYQENHTRTGADISGCEMKICEPMRFNSNTVYATMSIRNPEGVRPIEVVYRFVPVGQSSEPLHWYSFGINKGDTRPLNELLALDEIKTVLDFDNDWSGSYAEWPYNPYHPVASVSFNVDSAVVWKPYVVPRGEEGVEYVLDVTQASGVSYDSYGSPLPFYTSTGLHRNNFIPIPAQENNHFVMYIGEITDEMAFSISIYTDDSSRTDFGSFRIRPATSEELAFITETEIIGFQKEIIIDLEEGLSYIRRFVLHGDSEIKNIDLSYSYDGETYFEYSVGEVGFHIGFRSGDRNGTDTNYGCTCSGNSFLTSPFPIEVVEIDGNSKINGKLKIVLY